MEIPDSVVEAAWQAYQDKINNPNYTTMEAFRAALTAARAEWERMGMVMCKPVSLDEITDPRLKEFYLAARGKE